jgi:hypothetical protein
MVSETEHIQLSAVLSTVFRISLLLQDRFCQRSYFELYCYFSAESNSYVLVIKVSMPCFAHTLGSSASVIDLCLYNLTT